MEASDKRLAEYKGSGRAEQFLQDLEALKRLRGEEEKLEAKSKT